jgi:hypothetical protein
LSELTQSGGASSKTKTFCLFFLARRQNAVKKSEKSRRRRRRQIFLKGRKQGDLLLGWGLVLKRSWLLSKPLSIDFLSALSIPL